MKERIELPALVRLYWKRLKLDKTNTVDSGGIQDFWKREFIYIKVCVWAGQGQGAGSSELGPTTETNCCLEFHRTQAFKLSYQLLE